MTSGHAEIKGNEIADILAKEASTKAEITYMQFSDNIYTKLDIKRADMNNLLKKWQHNWENGVSVKHYHDYSGVSLFFCNVGTVGFVGGTFHQFLL